MPRLTVFLGAGGVGKTTLSAGYALALARAGGRVGLLSIDPARRLRSVVRMDTMSDLGVPVEGGLHAAMLAPEECLRRWATDSLDDAARQRLLANPFFCALADRLAGATDAIAAARAVEWAESDPALEELVIDTAPGLPALEFLGRPEKLLRFLEGRLVRSLRRFARLGSLPARGLARGLARISGESALLGVGEFVDLVDAALGRLTARLLSAQAWLRSHDTSLVLICGIDTEAARVAGALGDALGQLALAPRLTILNRVLPAIDVERLPANEEPARAFLRYVQGHERLQARVRAALTDRFPRVLELPERTLTGFDGLAALGDDIRRAMPGSA